MVCVLRPILLLKRRVREATRTAHVTFCVLLTISMCQRVCVCVVRVCVCVVCVCVVCVRVRALARARVRVRVPCQYGHIHLPSPFPSLREREHTIDHTHNDAIVLMTSMIFKSLV